MKNWISEYTSLQIQLLGQISADQLECAAQMISTAILADRQIFAFGNGGSASNASHFATDLGKGVADSLEKRVRVLSLTDNVPWITAIANDYNYDEVFLRQLSSQANPGDVVLAMSVSGSSPNIIKALEWCRSNGVGTIGLVGGKRGKVAEVVDMAIVVADSHYGRVEDMHMTVCHILCYAFIEKVRTLKLSTPVLSRPGSKLD